MSDSSRKFLFSVAFAAIMATGLIFFAIYRWQTVGWGPIATQKTEMPPLATPQPAKEESPELPATTTSEEPNAPAAQIPPPIVQSPPPTITRATTTLFDVPFTAQAPFANWDDPRQNYGCEEAVSLMAMRWIEERELDLREALDTIVAISEFEKQKYREFHDTSSRDTLEWIINDYFKYAGARLQYDIGIKDILHELAEGSIVIVPVNGRELRNPYYKFPGPIRHKILIKGYDDDRQEFIVNDPGTRRGSGYRYPYAILEKALMDYETGLDVPIANKRTAMIVISKKSAE